MLLDDEALRRVRRAVLPVLGPSGPVGTGAVIADGVVLTALHVIAPEPLDTLAVGERPVRAAATLPLARYGPDLTPALRSRHRALQLTGVDDGTVDLALLSAPGLRVPSSLPIRACPVRDGERMVVPGYPGGTWSLTAGPVIGHDSADFTVQLLLGPGASGAPVIDDAGRLAGVVTLDNESGVICVGPRLIEAFLRGMGVKLTETRG